MIPTSYARRRFFVVHARAESSYDCQWKIWDSCKIWNALEWKISHPGFASANPNHSSLMLQSFLVCNHPRFDIWHLLVHQSCKMSGESIWSWGRKTNTLGSRWSRKLVINYNVSKIARPRLRLRFQKRWEDWRVGKTYRPTDLRTWTGKESQHAFLCIFDILTFWHSDILTVKELNKVLESIFSRQIVPNDRKGKKPNFALPNTKYISLSPWQDSRLCLDVLK